jgi:hypothetical protein
VANSVLTSSAFEDLPIHPATLRAMEQVGAGFAAGRRPSTLPGLRDLAQSKESDQGHAGLVLAL